VVWFSGWMDTLLLFLERTRAGLSCAEDERVFSLSLILFGRIGFAGRHLHLVEFFLYACVVGD
jgi:hypothetical protein